MTLPNLNLKQFICLDADRKRVRVRLLVLRRKHSQVFVVKTGDRDRVRRKKRNILSEKLIGGVTKPNYVGACLSQMGVSKPNVAK